MPLTLPGLIWELVKAGVLVELTWNHGSVAFHVHGFYKIDPLLLTRGIESETLLAETPDGKTHILYYVKDIVELNYTWWEKSRDENRYWKTPTQAWRKLHAAFIEERK